MKLKDKIAIVTGGAKGMGKEFSRAFAREGAHVVVCARKLSALEEIAGEIKEMGRQTLAVSMDVADVHAVEAAVKQTVDKFGRVDILANTAGVIGPIETMGINVSAEDFENVWRTNTLGTFLTNKAVLKVMIPQRSGVIVNVAGTSGLRGYRMRVAYSSSKWGVIGVTKTLALEVGQYNIRVNAICPGATLGERMSTIVRQKAKVRGVSVDEIEQEYAEDMALKRWLKPTELASAAVFLASDDSSAMTGQAIAVDGGWDV
jgi:NAD(P)-dependent dehydrogenase (short-subunit alcohol dehydrogenase family)